MWRSELLLRTPFALGAPAASDWRTIPLIDVSHVLAMRFARITLIAVAGVAAAGGAGALAWHTTRPAVPSLIGLTSEDAVDAIGEAGLVPTVDYTACARLPSAACAVATQSLPAGTRASRSSVISVDLEPIEVEVPFLSGLTFAEAELAAGEVWLSVSMGYELSDPLATALAESAQFADDRRHWDVGSQVVRAGDNARAGQSIELKVTAPDVTVPSLAGKSAAKASTTLRAAGLLGAAPEVLDPSALTVVGQNPDPESQQPFGTQVELTFETKVPEVTTLQPDDAAVALTDVGLVPVITPGDAGWDWNLVGVSPAPGTSVPLGTTVTVNYEAPVIEYKVTGNGSRAMVTWIAPGSSSIAQDSSGSIPWTKTFPYSSYSIYSSNYGSIGAQALNGNVITCTLTVDGRVVDEQTSTGRYSVVMCSMS